MGFNYDEGPSFSDESKKLTLFNKSINSYVLNILLIYKKIAESLIVE